MAAGFLPRDVLLAFFRARVQNPLGMYAYICVLRKSLESFHVTLLARHFQVPAIQFVTALNDFTCKIREIIFAPVLLNLAVSFNSLIISELFM